MGTEIKLFAQMGQWLNLQDFNDQNQNYSIDPGGEIASHYSNSYTNTMWCDMIDNSYAPELEAAGNIWLIGAHFGVGLYFNLDFY